jgi:PAS domain S-box-containing protein
MRTEAQTINRRILVIDDTASIHRDFKSILSPNAFDNDPIEETEASLFGEEVKISACPAFEIDSAYQGREGLDMVQKAAAAGRPYALAFVDVRMPPGWDGIETISHLWRACPDLQVVICTAYSDYSWDEIVRQLKTSDNLLILKKPFDNIEARQLACTLTEKWSLARQAKLKLEDMEAMVARRTSELETANRALAEEVARRQTAQEALRSSRDNLSGIFNNVNVAILIHGADGSILAVNQKMLDLYRVKADEALQFSIARDYSAPQNPVDAIPALWQRILLGQTHAMEWLARRPGDGSTFPTEIYLCRITWGGHPVVMAAVYDLTEKKSLERQFLRAQRLENIGTLASGIAHDLNNILTPIIMSTQLLQLRRPEEAEVLANILTSAQRGADIVKQVLTFARGVEGEHGVLQPKHLIREIEKIALGTFPKSITFRSEVAKDLWAVNGDATQLHQVLLNLCVNARDAMPSGGALTVSAENVPAVKEKAGLFADAKAQPYVLITVGDTGTGIPPEILDKIFDPFFTTKEQGKGTGLGLSTVLGIVRSHGGFIDLDTQAGRGTVFKIYLPPAGSQIVTAESAPPAPSPRGTGECILVVDDESGIRTITERTLTYHGYQVLLATNGREALSVFAEHSERVKGVITDIMMPTMDGLALAQEIRRTHPQIPIVVCTGWTSETVQAQLKEVGVAAFLAKPCSSAMLLATLRHALAKAE